MVGIGCLDALLGINRQHVLTGGLERLWNWRRGLVHEVLDRPGHLLSLLRFRAEVLFLETFAKDLSQLAGSVCWIRA